MWEKAYSPFRTRTHYTADVDQMMRTGLAQQGAIDGGINWYRANIPELGNIKDTDYWPSKHAKTDVPALLIWGETDQTFVPEFIEHLPNYASKLSIETLPDIGHTPMLEAPDITNDLLKKFLAA